MPPLVRYGKGIIPDLYVVSPLQTGTGELFDVKTMRRGCRSRQVPGGDVNYACTRVAVPTRCGAINRREAKVAAEYVNHANGLDRQFAGYTRERQRAGEVGPVASALASFGGATGLAFGKYGARALARCFGRSPKSTLRASWSSWAAARPLTPVR